MAKTLDARRRDAADDVCFAVLLMMGLGGLEIPMGWRPLLAEPMQKWAKLAARTGLLKDEEDVAEVPDATGSA